MTESQKEEIPLTYLKTDMDSTKNTGCENNISFLHFTRQRKLHKKGEKFHRQVDECY